MKDFSVSRSDPRPTSLIRAMFFSSFGKLNKNALKTKCDKRKERGRKFAEVW